jgi:Holliday junction resolvase
MSRRGHDRERAVRDLLERDGWLVVRAAGSLGTCDLVAVPTRTGARHPAHGADGEALLLVEVKSTAGGPYEHFTPARRRELADLAHQVWGEAWLAWWAPRRPLQWISSERWPAR